MDFLICLWLLALLTRLAGADTCQLCAHVAKPVLRTGPTNSSLNAARSRV